MRLMMSDYDVELTNEADLSDFTVLFHGPADTPYEGGARARPRRIGGSPLTRAPGSWKLHMQIPQNYPYRSPSVGFQQAIWHPNIDAHSGSVCLDVLNQTWTPLFDLSNVLVFLGQLLQDPNPTDPLNSEAAALYLKDREAYNARVREYVRKYASPEALEADPGAADDGVPSEEDDLADFSEEELEMDL